MTEVLGPGECRPAEDEDGIWQKLRAEPDEETKRYIKRCFSTVSWFSFIVLLFWAVYLALSWVKSADKDSFLWGFLILLALIIILGVSIVLSGRDIQFVDVQWDARPVVFRLTLPAVTVLTLACMAGMAWDSGGLHSPFIHFLVAAAPISFYLARSWPTRISVGLVTVMLYAVVVFVAGPRVSEGAIATSSLFSWLMLTAAMTIASVAVLRTRNRADAVDDAAMNALSGLRSITRYDLDRPNLKFGNPRSNAEFRVTLRDENGVGFQADYFVKLSYFFGYWRVDYLLESPGQAAAEGKCVGCKKQCTCEEGSAVLVCRRFQSCDGFIS